MPGNAGYRPTSGRRSRPCLLSRGSLLRELHPGTTVPESQQGSWPLSRRRCRPDTGRPVHPALQGDPQGCTPAAGTGSAPFCPRRVTRYDSTHPCLCRCSHAGGCTICRQRLARRNWDPSCIVDGTDCYIRRRGIKYEDGDIDPVTACMAVIALVITVILGVALVRRWNRENRRRYPSGHRPDSSKSIGSHVADRSAGEHGRHLSARPGQAEGAASGCRH